MQPKRSGKNQRRKFCFIKNYFEYYQTRTFMFCDLSCFSCIQNYADVNINETSYYSFDDDHHDDATFSDVFMEGGGVEFSNFSEKEGSEFFIKRGLL